MDGLLLWSHGDKCHCRAVSLMREVMSRATHDPFTSQWPVTTLRGTAARPRVMQSSIIKAHAFTLFTVPIV